MAYQIYFGNRAANGNSDLTSEGDTAICYIHRDESGFSEDITWKLIFPGDINLENKSAEPEDISSPLTGTVNFKEDELITSFEIETSKDGLVELEQEIFEVGLLNKGYKANWYIYDGDTYENTSNESNVLNSIGLNSYDKKGYYFNLSEGEEYSIGLFLQDDQDEANAMFSILNPWGEEIEKNIREGEDYIYTAEMSGLYGISAFGIGDGNFDIKVLTSMNNNKQKAQQRLDEAGISMADASNFLLANINSPQIIYDVAKSNYISEEMLSGIVNVDILTVRSFFDDAGLDSLLL